MRLIDKVALPNCKHFDCVQFLDMENGFYDIRLYDSSVGECFGHSVKIFHGKNFEVASFMFQEHSNYYLNNGDFIYD